MKTIRNMFILAALLMSLQVVAQTDKATTLRIVNEQNFVFTATSAMPMANADVNRVLSRMGGGAGTGTIQLTGAQYQVKITKDSVDAYLPYYGRAYTATMNPDDAGIKFKAKEFDYKAEKKKKGNWSVNIRPKNVKDSPTLNLSISENGYATLMVNSNNRQPISFYGYISEPEKPKVK
jgi:hypothetical protein